MSKYAASADLAEKRCARCQQTKQIEQFGRVRRYPDGREKWCRVCNAAYDRTRLRGPNVRARQRETHRRWYVRHRERVLAQTKALNERLRTEVLTAYGARCTCCGETTREFLLVDHVSGGGRQHRLTTTGQGRSFYLWLKRQGFPTDLFRLPCHNCNIARGHHGYCPHEHTEDYLHE